MAHLKKSDSGHLIKGPTGHMIKDCTCCGDPCPDCCGCWYKATFSDATCDEELSYGECPDCEEENGCLFGSGTPPLVIYFQFNCEDSSSGTDEEFSTTTSTLDITYSGGVYTVTVCPGPPCFDGTTRCWIGTFESACPPTTLVLEHNTDEELHMCTGDITVTFEKVYCPACCPCLGKCYAITISGGGGSCESCTQELFDSTSAVVSCPGLPYIAWRDPSTDEWDFIPTDIVPPGAWFFLIGFDIDPACGDTYVVSYAGVIDMIGTSSCWVPGTYALTPVYFAGGEENPCPDDLYVEIVEISCCDTCTDQPYYLSCDIAFTQHSDGGGGITNCDGTGGTEDCNTSASLTDEELVQTGSGECTWNSENEFPCHFPALSGSGVQLRCYEGRWELLFGDLTGTYPELITAIIGLSPVGIYPDITICFNDGYIAYDLSITNIVVTA